MKKILIVMQIIILVLVMAKIVSTVGLFKKTDVLPIMSFLTDQAMAQQTSPAKASSAVSPAPQVTKTQPVKESAESNLSQERDLAAALSAKKSELDSRENTLRTEEQRLLALRKEIMDKIALLKAQEEKLTTILDASQNSETKRYKEMAKVYEATPPAKAGSMLDKLDVKTAAGITMNMKKDKAGAIWGFISPQRAVEITREITRTGRAQSE